MHSFATVVALVSAAALASAQGRYPCSRLVNGVVTPFPAMCSNANIAANADAGPIVLGNVNGGLKQNGYVPVNSQCMIDYVTQNYYCGYLGASCTQGGIGAGANTNCDNGVCVGGKCSGGIGSPCNGDDSQCIGKIYCNDPSGNPTNSNVCGGLSNNANPFPPGPQGAFCDDGTTVAPEQNYFCESRYCNLDTSACGVVAVASARARSRRNEISPRGARCPASHSACVMAGTGRGFECIDTSSNLEQCGACANAGGVDCTQLPGVDAVGCVAGKCEIWACAEGFAWDATTASCAVSLTV